MAKTCNEIINEIGSTLRPILEGLYTLWDEIGFEDSQRIKRQELVSYHMHNLLDEMVTEERELKKRVTKNIEKNANQLLQLTNEMQMSPHEPPANLSLVRLEKHLRLRVDDLSQQKEERMKQFNKLRESDQHLCDIMCTTPYYVPSNLVPSSNQINELQKHIRELKAEKNQRESIYHNMKTSIKQLLGDLEEGPNTSFERDIICDEEDSFQLSSENMKLLRHYQEELEQKQKKNFSLASQLRDRILTLWDRLQIPEDERAAFNSNNTGYKPAVIHRMKSEISCLEKLKLQNIRQVIDKTRVEIHNWWEKCFCSQEERKRFRPYYEENFTENALEEHDLEVSRLRAHYDSHRNLFEHILRWQILWRTHQEFERKATDPNRLFNRGCTLLKEESKRKKLAKELPRVEADVKDLLDEWAKEQGRPFLVNGLPFVSLIEEEQERYRLEKENEKTSRSQQKARQTEEEMLYGSRPVATTPGKRRYGPTTTTPGKTPTKQRKLNPGHASQSVSSQSSTLSSMASSTTSFKSSTLGKAKPKQFNDVSSRTPITPGKHTRSNHTTVYSPYGAGPRSASKSRMHAPPSATQTLERGKRRALGDTNHLYSQTTVSGASERSHEVADSSLASIGQYNDFARGLNTNARPNCRSSVMPKAFF